MARGGAKEPRSKLEAGLPADSGLTCPLLAKARIASRVDFEGSYFVLGPAHLPSALPAEIGQGHPEGTRQLRLSGAQMCLPHYSAESHLEQRTQP